MKEGKKKKGKKKRIKESRHKRKNKRKNERRKKSKRKKSKKKEGCCSGGRSFSHLTAKSWNALPLHLRTSLSLTHFKKGLKTWFFE